jgi:hypothetical protein
MSNRVANIKKGAEALVRGGLLHLDSEQVVPRLALTLPRHAELDRSRVPQSSHMQLHHRGSGLEAPKQAGKTEVLGCGHNPKKRTCECEFFKIGPIAVFQSW